MAMQLPQPSMFKKLFMLMSLCVSLLGTTTEGRCPRKYILSTLPLAKELNENERLSCKNHTFAEPYLHTKMSKLTFTESWNFLHQVYDEFRINIMIAPSAF